MASQGFFLEVGTSRWSWGERPWVADIWGVLCEMDYRLCSLWYRGPLGALIQTAFGAMPVSREPSHEPFWVSVIGVGQEALSLVSSRVESGGQPGSARCAFIDGESEDLETGAALSGAAQPRPSQRGTRPRRSSLKHRRASVGADRRLCSLRWHRAVVA